MIKIKKIFFQLIILTGSIFILLIVFTIIYCSVGPEVSIEAEKFRAEGNYTDEELLLFSDIAFSYNRIRKWEEDIKVEIRNMEHLTFWEIAEVDSVIAAYATLVYPLKLYRVTTGGNLIVHHRVESLPRMKENRGFCQTNSFIPGFTWKITDALVYVLSYENTPRTLSHEFEHALGLSHPSKEYPFYMVISIKLIFQTFDEYDKYKDIPFYIPEIDKKIIKMLYSSYIRSGLKKSVFMKKMELKDL